MCHKTDCSCCDNVVDITQIQERSKLTFKCGLKLTVHKVLTTNNKEYVNLKFKEYGVLKDAQTWNKGGIKNNRNVGDQLDIVSIDNSTLVDWDNIKPLTELDAVHYPGRKCLYIGPHPIDCNKVYTVPLGCIMGEDKAGAVLKSALKPSKC